MAESFAERWAKKERDCGLVEIAARMVPFGKQVLPDSTAPYLSFETARHPKPIFHAYGSESDWSDADRQRLAAFQVIGSDGAGNAICVDARNGAVVLLDHEDGFRTSQFINSSAGQLAECLLAYMGERNAEVFKSAVRSIDSAAITDGSFWWYEANQIENTEV
jgi:hypothetical protein